MYRFRNKDDISSDADKPIQLPLPGRHSMGGWENKNAVPKRCRHSSKVDPRSSARTTVASTHVTSLCHVGCPKAVADLRPAGVQLPGSTATDVVLETMSL